MSATGLSVLPVPGVPEVPEGADLAVLLVEHARSPAVPDGLQDGDIVLVTSKVVSKAEGRLRSQDRAQAVQEETAGLLAVRGDTRIVRTRHGFVLAAAGVDASNTPAGTVLLLPVDPDASARRLRERVGALTGRNVGVVVTDTAGRAWRTGQTDLAVGVAGLHALDDHAGRHDRWGNELAVTAPAVADELAAAAELATGKLSGLPFAVVRGQARRVLPAGVSGDGVRPLLRDPEHDMFALGAREAVLAALAGDHRPFGGPAPAGEVAAALRRLLDETARVALQAGTVTVHGDAATTPVVRAVAAAHGWTSRTDVDGWVLTPARGATP